MSTPAIVRAAVEDAFRDFTTAGIPGSGAHEPSKAEIREALGVILEATLSSIGSGISRYADVALMDAVTTAVNGQLAYVYANNDDPADPANGIYQWDDVAEDWVTADWYLASVEAIAQPILDETEAARDLARAYAVSDTDASISGAVSPDDRGSKYWADQAAASAAELAAFPTLALDGDGALVWVDSDGFNRPISVGQANTSYFPFLGDSIAQGYGNSIGDASPTTKAYEMDVGPVLIYPLVDPVGGAIGGSMMPAFANEYTAQTKRRVVIEELGTGSSYLLAAGSAGSNWSSAGTLLAAAVARINASTAALIANPDINTDDLKVEPVIFLGTNDAAAINGTTITGALFGAELAVLFAYLVANVTGLTAIHVYQIGDDNDGSPSTINEKFREIRAAIETAVAAEPLARIVSRVARSLAYDAKRLMWDQVHPNQTGHNLLGTTGGTEAAKVTPTVPYAALTPLAVTLYEDTNTATANSRTVAHTPQAGCKAMVVMVGIANNTTATGTTISGVTLDGVAMTRLNEEISQINAAGTSSAARIGAFLLNNASGFAATPLDIIASLAAVHANLSIAVVEYDEVVVQEAGWAFKSNAAVTELERKAYSALDCSAVVMAMSVATSAAALTHTMTGVTEADEGGQTDGTNASQVVIAEGPIDKNVETLIKAVFSATVRCAVLYAVLVRRPEDGEI